MPMHLFNLVANILNPPILFFFLGMIAIFFGVQLRIPKTLSRFLSLYLLLAIGLKGGIELGRHGVDGGVCLLLLSVVLFACCIPVYAFFLLRNILNTADAAALAASYGSVSVVTFITATSFLDQLHVAYNDYMVTALALTESPAIVLGVLLYRLFSTEPVDESVDVSWRHVLHDALFNESNYLLIGSLLVGLASSHSDRLSALTPFTHQLFEGLLCLFLLDLGLSSSKRLKELLSSHPLIWSVAILLPALNAILAVGFSQLLGLGLGNALLFCVLASSASYIAVPAALRIAIPKASPSIYVTLPLAITFPFNVLLGLPLYYALLHLFYR